MTRANDPSALLKCAHCGGGFLPSRKQREKVSTARRKGENRRAFCPTCSAAARVCKVCSHDRVGEIDHLIVSGVIPSEIIKSLHLSGVHTSNIASHRMSHVKGIRRVSWAPGRCLVCESDLCAEVDRLARVGLRPEEIASALSTPYPAKCIGMHRRRCLGIPDVVNGKRVPDLKAKRVRAANADLPGLTPEQKRVRHNQMIQARSRALRLRVIAEYGGACACCGETREPFLCLDHEDGGGAAHRRALTGEWSRGAGSRTYRWLEANGFPRDGFRVLCHNCNCARGMRGVCPHETERARGETGAA